MIAAVVAAVCVAATAALVYMIWRFDRRDNRRIVLDAEQIVAAEARRINRNHPSMWGQS